jgi:hypothetical protein
MPIPLVVKLSFDRTRVSNLLDVARPLSLGVLAAAITRAALLTHSLPDWEITDAGTVIAVGAAIPLLGAVAVSFGQTLWIDINAQSVRVRRLFAPVRIFRPASLMFWGFKRGLGIWSTWPPGPGAARRTRFRIETKDGYCAEATIATEDAPWIADLMHQCLPGERTLLQQLRT